MWPFRKKSVEQNNLQLYLQQSFASVQNDTQRLHQWLHFLYQKTQSQDQTINHLQQQLSSIPTHAKVDVQEVRNIIDNHFSLQELQQRILMMQQHLDEQRAAQGTHGGYIAALQNRLDGLKVRSGQAQPEPIPQPVKKRAHFQEKIVKNIAKHSKSYLKSMAHKLIDKYEKISVFQLKEIMVDEQKLCSKSSFYRLIEEVERENVVGVLQDGRQKFFVSKVMIK